MPEPCALMGSPRRSPQTVIHYPGSKDRWIKENAFVLHQSTVFKKDGKKHCPLKLFAQVHDLYRFFSQYLCTW